MEYGKASFYLSAPEAGIYLFYIVPSTPEPRRERFKVTLTPKLPCSNTQYYCQANGSNALTSTAILTTQREVLSLYMFCLINSI